VLRKVPGLHPFEYLILRKDTYSGLTSLPVSFLQAFDDILYNHFKLLAKVLNVAALAPTKRPGPARDIKGGSLQSR
jgi:hypothetical protein